MNVRAGPRTPAKTATSAVRAVTSRTSVALRSTSATSAGTPSEVVVSGALRLSLDDLGDLVDRLVELAVLVHDDVVVFRRGRHLDLRIPQPHGALLRCLGAAMLEAALQRFDRRRHDEDGQRLRQLRLDFPHTLRIGLDDHDLVAAQRVAEDVAPHSLELAVYDRPLEEVACLDLLAELLGRVEVVPDAIDLAGPRLTACRGDVDDGVVQLLHELIDDDVLSPTGRRRDDHEQALAVDAHVTSENSGDRDEGAPSVSR